MNTRIDYLYVDAGNYRVYNTCIVSGEASSLQQALIREACLPGQNRFIPSCVGLPEKRFPRRSSGGTPFFELMCFSLTERKADVPMDVSELLRRFQAMRHHWLERMAP